MRWPIICSCLRLKMLNSDWIRWVATGWDPTAAAGWGVGAAVWKEAHRCVAAWSSGTAPHSPAGCMASDSNPALDGLCRSWRCGSQLCSSPAGENEEFTENVLHKGTHQGSNPDWPPSGKTWLYVCRECGWWLPLVTASSQHSRIICLHVKYELW